MSASDRDLGGSLFLDDKQRPSWCEEKCGQHKFTVFGLQYGNECWCGSGSIEGKDFGKYGKLDESKCSYPCAGSPGDKCGGELVNSVYRITEKYEVSADNANDDRPLLALVMIVKDEAHTLPNTLQAIKPYIDYYYILDTGSTDGTQQSIARTLGEKGEIHEEPFIDYGTSRNRVLEIAQKSEKTGKQPIFVLMLSADETVYNAESLRKFCEEHRYSDGPMHEAYAVVMDVGWRFDSLRLSRSAKGWRYQGKVHEYLAAPDGKWHPTLRVPNTYIKFKVTDPERRAARENIIREILEREVAEKPNDTRSSFYLARTYNVLGNHTAALQEFRRRISLGGWSEEVYESYYAIAWQLDALKYPWLEVQQAFLDAHEHSPERAEPLYAIASHYYKESKFGLSYMFASAAAQLEYPKNAVLWVQAAVYQWQANFLIGMTGLRLKHSKEGALAMMIVTKFKPDDELVKQQLQRYKDDIRNEKIWKALQCKAQLKECDQQTEKAAQTVIEPAANSAPTPAIEEKIKEKAEQSQDKPSNPLIEEETLRTKHYTTLTEPSLYLYLAIGAILSVVIFLIIRFSCRKKGKYSMDDYDKLV